MIDNKSSQSDSFIQPQQVGEFSRPRRFGRIAGATIAGSLLIGSLNGGDALASPDDVTPIEAESPDTQPETVSLTVNRDVVELPTGVITENIAEDGLIVSKGELKAGDSGVDEISRRASGSPKQAVRMNQVEQYPALEKLPEPGEVPANIKELLREDTTYMQPIGCSGSLILDEAGVALASRFAEHCDVRDTQLPRYYREDGSGYVLRSDIGGDFEAYIGDNTDEMTLAGRASHLIVPQSGDISQDSAIAVFEEQDPLEVLSLLAEGPHMEVGDEAYMSGFPVHQDNGEMAFGALERQEWSMIFIGYEDIAITSGEYLQNVATFAMKSSEDGAECSYGASGAVAYNKNGDVVGSALAGFNDLKVGAYIKTQEEADQVRISNEWKHNVDLEGFDAVCSFTPELTEPNLEILEILDNLESHPDEQNVVNRALENLYDPTQPETYIDGVFSDLVPQKGGPGSLAYVNNPVLYRDEQTEHHVLFWSDSNEDEASYRFLPKGIDYTFYYNRSVGETDATAVVDTDGQVVRGSTKFNPAGSYSDINGTKFGNLLDTFPADQTEQWILYIDDSGAETFQPAVL